MWGMKLKFFAAHSLALLVMVVLLPFLVQATGCGRIQEALIQRQIDAIEEGNRRSWIADDAMHVVLCGTGTPLLDLERAGACTAIIAGGQMYLIDVGPGSTERSLEYRLPLEYLGGIFLTHFHSDHIGELGEVVTQSWIAGRATPLDVYGPSGVSGVVEGFQRAYSLDQQYRTEHHGQGVMPKEGAQMRAHTVIADLPGTRPVFESNGLKVFAINVDHRPVVPALAYRFEYGGRAVVISGDTSYSENLAKRAKGADLLVHEILQAELLGNVSEAMSRRGLARLSKLTSDVRNYHTTPAQALKIARAAGVETLVFTHVAPSLPRIVARRAFFEGLDDRGNIEVVLGEDGMHFRLGADGLSGPDQLD